MIFIRAMTSPDEPFSAAEKKGEGDRVRGWRTLFFPSAFCQLCFMGTQAWRPSTHPHLNKRRDQKKKKPCRFKELMCSSQICSPVQFTSLLLSLLVHPALFFCHCADLQALTQAPYVLTDYKENKQNQPTVVVSSGRRYECYVASLDSGLGL